MKAIRKCKVCGNEFTAKKTTQFFCQRKCFKKDFYIRTKNRLQEIKDRGPNYPSKECGFCFKVSKLPFDPIKDFTKYNSWGCPYCGATNRMMWTYKDSPNSYHIIEQLLITVRSSVITSPEEQRHEVFQLPVRRLEQGNPSIVVLSCEKMNISDVQRKDRKRILFS